jgi:hypothetical protein
MDARTPVGQPNPSGLSLMANPGRKENLPTNRTVPGGLLRLMAVLVEIAGNPATDECTSSRSATARKARHPGDAAYQTNKPPGGPVQEAPKQPGDDI